MSQTNLSLDPKAANARPEIIVTNVEDDPRAVKFRAEIIGKLDERIVLLAEMRDRCKGEESRARFDGKIAGVQAVKERVKENMRNYPNFAPLHLLLGQLPHAGAFSERFTDEYQAKQSGIREANNIIWEYRR